MLCAAKDVFFSETPRELSVFCLRADNDDDQHVVDVI